MSSPERDPESSAPPPVESTWRGRAIGVSVGFMWGSIIPLAFFFPVALLAVIGACIAS